LNTIFLDILQSHFQLIKFDKDRKTASNIINVLRINYRKLLAYINC